MRKILSMPTLNWIGKEKVVNHVSDVPIRTLEHVEDCNGASENKIIHGDNLEALKALLPEYEGSIKCIYIDPPYNTGNENWIYNDNVNDPKIKKWLGEVVGKEGEDLSRHDKWLCMMYPRLKLLQMLLAKDGAIFISIDDNEQANLRLLCDEIFGANNFVANIIWQKKYSPQNDSKWLSDSHDFIVVYAKNKELWRPFLLQRSDEMNARYKNPDNDPRGPWKPADFSARTYSSSGDYPITLPSGRIVNPPASRAWITNKNRFEELVKDNRIWFGKEGNSIPSQKKFLTEVKQGTVCKTIWLRDEVGDNQQAKQTIKDIFSDVVMSFDTPKPSTLIERILEIALDKDSVILDSFAGSGTTAHAVLNLNKKDGGNRRFILVEMEDYAKTITAERVKRVINGYDTTEGTGGNFSYYELGERLFDEEGNINPNIDVEKLRCYVWFSETHSPYKKEDGGRYLLGTYNDTGYYFYYEKDKPTILSDDRLNIVTKRADQYIIFADACLIPEKELAAKHIIFKKIPRDIRNY